MFRCQQCLITINIFLIWTEWLKSVISKNKNSEKFYHYLLLISSKLPTHKANTSHVLCAKQNRLRKDLGLREKTRSSVCLRIFTNKQYNQHKFQRPSRSSQFSFLSLTISTMSDLSSSPPMYYILGPSVKCEDPDLKYRPKHPAVITHYV